MLTMHRRRPLAADPEPLYDRRGFYRSPITLPSYRAGQPSAIKGRKFPPEPLTPDEVWSLVDACGHGLAGRRNRALIVVMWRGGLRVSEAVALMPKDVDTDRGRVAVLHGKGDKSRIVALDAGACAIVDRWRLERDALELGPRAPLFCVISQPTAGRPLATSYVRELLHKLGERAGIAKRVHPHGLRHSYASYLMDQGVPIHHIRRMLGHSSIAVTERYADHINPAAVLEQMRALDWPDQAA